VKEMAKRKIKRKTQKRKLVRKKKVYAGKTEKEWRDMGAELGKHLDRRSRSFSEGMERWGDDFGKRMEEHGKKIENWWIITFGFIGPLLGSIINIIFIAIAIVILNFINSFALNSFIFLLSNFFSMYIYWFFLASLFFGYCNYLSIKYQRRYWLISPIVNSLNIIFVIWIIASIFNIIGIYVNAAAITAFSGFVLVSLLALLSIFIVLGYVFEISKKIFYLGHRR
jgi:hypothetical protein